MSLVSNAYNSDSETEKNEIKVDEKINKPDTLNSTSSRTKLEDTKKQKLQQI